MLPTRMPTTGSATDVLVLLGTVLWLPALLVVTVLLHGVLVAPRQEGGGGEPSMRRPAAGPCGPAAQAAASRAGRMCSRGYGIHTRVGGLSPVTAGRSSTATAPARTAGNRSYAGISSGSAPVGRDQPFGGSVRT